MANGTYILVQKIINKVADETKCEELLVSDDIMDILNELMNNLEIHKSWGDAIEMTDAKSFVSDTFDNLRTYIYSIEFKRNPEVMRFKE